ncbi:GNAT family N-acetyltransferase [Actinotalea sp. M2MS4P-6]|uniref:GNAT family N-acetyltransferase n=1 Tax=Actinotalea sp. M2MS4P-6 TaxID=2983762 RepID=UPI0021E3678E|nr:GNAT family N-acetyltransferase [Actinotalea sp. M2MS4P-6]MCV2396246.1 GNAT family N-acetyltransferase [Actinotalea sp. M2MS4P-6]
MTPLPDGYTAVDLTADHHRELLTIDAWAFPDSIDLDKVAEWPLPIVWERARGVRAADGELVAVHASYPYTGFPVPGARTPVAGLTWVGVHPGHRRRGLLSSMIEDHMTRSLDRGEAVSALYAAELAIYGRFGYGHAARSLRLTVPRGAALRDVPGADQVRIRLVSADADAHGALVAELHDAVDRPGWAPRSSAEQRAAFLHDPPEWRRGAEPLRIAIAERDGTAVGYAMLRRKMDWRPEGPRGVVRVGEVVVKDAAAARALWGVLLDLDLMATVEVGNLAVDDPLVHLLVDSRAAQPQLRDDLWIRILDLPVALAARRYQAPVDVVLEVTDTRLPANAGRWRLVGGPDGAEVTRTGDAPDLALDVRELGAAYLGGVSLEGLAAAGLVTEHVPGSARAAAIAFGWPVAPVSSWIW